QYLLQPRDIFRTQSAVGVEQAAIGAGIDPRLFHVPLREDAQNINSILLELPHPAPALLRTLIEGPVVNGIVEADASVRERRAVQEKAGSRDRDLMGGRGRRNNGGHQKQD